MCRRPVERQIWLVERETLYVERQLACMIVPPLARFAARHVRSGRHMIPAVRPVIDRVQQEALMSRVLAEIWSRGVEERVRDAQPGLPVSRPIRPLPVEEEPEPQEALSCNRRRRAVDRLAIVEGIGRAAG